MNAKTTSTIGLAIIAFLQREGGKSTFQYERWPILIVEALCLFAGIWAAPTTQAAWLAAVTAPLALWGAEVARVDRSTAARKAERAAALGLPKIELTCEAAVVQAAKNKQLLAAAAPVVGLAMSVAGAGGAGLSRAVVVGFVVSVVRWAMIELYGVWRRWYRSQVPVKVAAVVGTRKSAVVEYEDWRPSEGLLAKVISEAIDRYDHPRIVARCVDDYLLELVTKYSATGTTRFPGETARCVAMRVVHGLAMKPAPTQLAETSPYQSADLARMAEDVLRAKGNADEEYER